MHISHHVHHRERAKLKKDPYPHHDKYVRFLDNTVIAAGVIGPLMTLPQILKIFFEKTAQGVSLLTFLFLALLSIPWIIYGIVHKEKVIVMTYVLWLIMNSIVVAGIIIY